MILDMRAVNEKIRQFGFKCEHVIDLWDKYSEECEEIEDDMVEWVKENASGHAMYHHNFRWGFERQEDLIAFKLMWS